MNHDTDTETALIELRWLNPLGHQGMVTSMHTVELHDGALLDETFNELAPATPGYPTGYGTLTLAWDGWTAWIATQHGDILGIIRVQTGAGA